MKTPTIAIVATGEMGSAIGDALSKHGARVITSVAGRSAESVERAKRAGFETFTDDGLLVAQADFILSVVPPASAPALAKRFAPILKESSHKPIYVDCNAISPNTVRQIGEVLSDTGAAYLDGCLFGGPTSGKPGVFLYVSGEKAGALTVLDSLGIRIQVIDGPIGAASAMKLAFAGLNKGFTGLGATMIMAAIQAGSGLELAQQLENSQPDIMAYVSRFIPAMYPKAYRWDEEMLEIADFMKEDEDAAVIYEAMSRIYRRLAAKIKHQDPDMDVLKKFCVDLKR